VKRKKKGRRDRGGKGGKNREEMGKKLKE